MSKIVWLDKNEIKEKLIPERGLVSLGRGADNSIVLTDPRVSRYHAQLVCGIHGCLLKDLKSTNGVQVNGESVHSRFLQDGDVICIGNHVMEFLSQERLQRLGVGARSAGGVTSLRVTTGGLARPAVQADATAQRGFLRYIDGPDKGRVQTIDRPLLPVGDPEGFHAAISCRTNGFYLLNLGKSLHVQLNSNPVHGAGVLLQDGDRITLGDSQVELRIFRSGES